VKATESGGPRGYDAGKKVKGRKRQAMVDTDGRGLILEPQPADVQDRDGAPLVLRLSRRSFPFIAKAFADMASANGLGLLRCFVLRGTQGSEFCGRKRQERRFLRHAQS
jgi:hypothetical protein